MSLLHPNRRSVEKDPAAQAGLIAAVSAGILALFALVFGLVWKLRRTRPEAAPRPKPAAAVMPVPAADPHPTATGETSAHYENPRMPEAPFVFGIVSFFATIIFILVVVWNLANIWTQGGKPFSAPPSAPSDYAGWTTRQPQLQVDPGMDLEALQHVEHQRLHTVRWADASHAYACIPIETAMQLLGNAAAPGGTNTLLPPPRPATPIDLQDQKSRAAAPQVPNP